jgi:group I intron endonuclease
LIILVLICTYFYDLLEVEVLLKLLDFYKNTLINAPGRASFIEKSNFFLEEFVASALHFILFGIPIATSLDIEEQAASLPQPLRQGRGCFLLCSTQPANFLLKRVEEIKPIKVYKNFKEEKSQLKTDQKDKIGIYCLVNLINGNIYIGSSVNIGQRMTNYLNNPFLKNNKNKNMPIIQALLKYGQENFALLVVEYVYIENLSVRETYYITQFLPYYNVLKEGYSSLGYKHTEITKKMLRELALNRKHSDKTKALISKALVGSNNPFFNKNHSTESKLRIIEAKSAYPVYIYNSFKILLVICPSVKTLAKLINTNHKTIVSFLKNGSLFRGEWYFSNLPFNINEKPIISKWSVEQSSLDTKTLTYRGAPGLILEMINSSHIKKAIFVYKISPEGSKEFIRKFDGVTQAQQELNINHDVIKKNAKINRIFKGFIFSYERLFD